MTAHGAENYVAELLLFNQGAFLGTFHDVLDS